MFYYPFSKIMEYYSAVTRGEARACGEPGKHAKCEKSVTSGHGLDDSICTKCPQHAKLQRQKAGKRLPQPGRGGGLEGGR